MSLLESPFRAIKLGYATLCLVAAVALVLGVQGCATPTWWDDPLKDDGDNWCYAATGTSRVSEDEALERAVRAARGQIVDELHPQSDAFRAYLLTRLPLMKVRTRESERRVGMHRVWILLQLPKEQLEALRVHAHDAPKRFEAAERAFAAAEFAHVLEATSRLIAEYPVGRQPVFPTERALLLASDGHEALGRPAEAIAACESLLAGSQDAAFRRGAEERLERLRRNRGPLLLRGALGGRKVRVECRASLDGKPAPWIKMQSLVEELVVSAGGGLADDASAPDTVLRLTAHGTMRLQANPVNAFGGTDFVFEGRIEANLHSERGPRHAWTQDGRLMNPASAAVCLDMLAILSFDAWKADLLKMLEVRE